MRRITIIAGVALVLCMLLAWQPGPAWDVMVGLGLGWLAIPVTVATYVPKSFED